MRSLSSLRQWMQQLLPDQSAASQEGAWQLVRALMVDFTVQLCGLARQLDRGTDAASGRQYLFRWLSRSGWNPPALYQQLLQFWPQELRQAATLPLLIDCTVLGERWNVLQVSLPWQGRALPVYQAVVHYRRPEAGQTELLLAALAWLATHLPGPRSRYVLVLDRGFPSHALIRVLQEQGWRYVVRIGSNWKLTHPDYTGPLGQACGAVPAVQRQGRWFGDGVLGRRGKGRQAWCQTHAAAYADPAHQEIWLLATSEASWEVAVAIYRQRMQIEGEFRDVKGPQGLDHLEQWGDSERVARLLAWVSVYEWRLALLYRRYQLQAWGRQVLQVGGALSWITITRAWIKRHRQQALGRQTLVRDTP